MKITVICGCDQALWMAKSEFESSGIHMLDMIKITRKNGCFVIPIEDEGSEAFLEFVQGNQKNEKSSNETFYSKNFRTDVRSDSVRGFVSQESLSEAIDLFNRVQTNYYVDPCVDIAEINTDMGVLFIPEINDCRLESLFWTYVTHDCHQDSIEECVAIGNEVLNG